MVTYADVRTWDPGPLGQAGEGLKKAVATLEASRDEVAQKAVPSSWNGLARVAAQARQKILVSSMDARIERGSKLAKGLLAAEADVTTLRRMVDDTEGAARAQEFTISGDGSVTSTMDPPTFRNRYEAEEWGSGRQSQAQALAGEVERIMQRAVAIDSALLQVIPWRDSESELRGVADPEVAYEWSKMSQTEKEAVLRQIVEEELADLDLDPPPTVTFVDPDDPDAEQTYRDSADANGWWSSSRNEIWINPDALDDPRRLHTAAHEARHARQSDAVDSLDRSFWDHLTGRDPFAVHEQAGVSREQAERWRENFAPGNYIQSGDPRPGGGTYTYEDYTQQPVEADAFGRGRDYLNGLTPEELERLRKESR